MYNVNNQDNIWIYLTNIYALIFINIIIMLLYLMHAVNSLLSNYRDIVCTLNGGTNGPERTTVQLNINTKVVG